MGGEISGEISGGRAKYPVSDFIICWDIRNMDEPSLVVDLNEQSIGSDSNNRITCLEYDTCLPHRFMLGTSQGSILSCNRRYKEPREMIAASYSAKYGPVLGIQRNSFFPKIFASCSTWNVKIWAEDIVTSPMLNLIPDTGYVTDAAWCGSHSSFLLMTKTTGHIELWDILLARQAPLLSFKLATEGLSRLKYKQNSNQIACGTPNGCIHLLEVPEYSGYPCKPERTVVAAMIDREYRREKLLEAMAKEQMLKEQLQKEENQIETSGYHIVGVSKKRSLSRTGNIYEGEIEASEVAEEFKSDFDSYVQEDEDVIDDNVSEKPFFDLRFEDSLTSISEESTSSNV